MVEMRQLPTKHLKREMSDDQENEIRKLQEERNYLSFLEAKHEYYESLDAQENKVEVQSDLLGVVK